MLFPIFKKEDRVRVPVEMHIFHISSIVYNITFSFVEKHNILYKNQYGFRSRHSTDLAVTYVTDNILKALDNKQYVIGVFMDLAKAFDTINHKIL